MTEREAKLDPVLLRIAAALDGLRFGTVEIAVHDSKIVYVERRERLRIENEEERLPSRASGATGRPERARERRTS